ncbi:hypothetical protein EKN06_07075 [Croceicoccus ponticola]|uniref:DUF4124 domain-containing protein n=1 Tax=Croceicoccus ponticola TaxID=2217664 RepID=A0A437GYF7_9SPHN|nr:hypothetical protein [Croceicoccus ponticola]RVQ67689.1 hypothetical protein EKN06_07075 [Croceicoccus ponticola]
MTRLSIAVLAATAGFGLALTAAAIPAAAQETEAPVNQVIVYGDQECPASTEQQIVVCVRQEDPYRIPKTLRQSDDKENVAWSERVAANRDVGDTGVGSCNTVGPAGQTGCTLEAIQQAYAEKANSSDVQMGKLVAEARAARLAEIDEEARATQERVESIEADYETRRKAEEAAAGEVDPEPLPNPTGN